MLSYTIMHKANFIGFVHLTHYQHIIRFQLIYFRHLILKSEEATIRSGKWFPFVIISLVFFWKDRF